MISHSLEETLKTLTYYQASILYWTCEGWSNENIAARHNYTKAWVVWQMSFVYHKLGIDRIDKRTGKKPHWTERRAFLQEKVCPILRRLLNDDPERLEIFPIIPPNVYEGDIIYIPAGTPKEEIPLSETTTPRLEPQSEPPQLPQPSETPPPEPPSDFYPIELYNAWLAVLEDDKHGDLPPPPIIVGPERRGIMWGRILALGLVVLLACALVGALAFWLGRQNQTPLPTDIPSNTPEVLATETFAETATITLTTLPTETLGPTFTPTLTLTITPIPTDTKSPLDLRIGDVLEDSRVSLRLTNIGYGELYDRIGSRRAPISYYFDFVNHSGETIVLQFDQYNFENTDDRGQTTNCWFFHISGAGPAVNEPLANGATRQIIARCGDGQLDPAVNMFTLTVHPFSSLPESKWIVEIPR